MSLQPLIDASPAIQIHTAAAVAAFVLGLIQFAGPKGTLPHRALGWVWVGLMAVVALSAFFIHELRVWGPFSPIHLLAILVLVMLPRGIIYARRQQVRGHRLTMLGLFIGALVAAGVFTLMPGRIMHAVLFGG